MTHDATGTSIFGPDREVPLFHPMGPTGSSFAVFDVRSVVPVNNLEPAQEHANMIPRCPPNGVIFCITNIPPNFSVPMHRTLSLDYAIVMNGEIIVKADNGEEKTVRAGEFIIQGGANHQWINKTDETCRIGFVMVGSEKIRLANGTELDGKTPSLRK
jgi:quercetin dioxygenase-like cupin family protein